MRKHMRTLLITAAVAGLAGCSPEADAFRGLQGEAGAEIDLGDFGSATSINIAAMTRTESYAIDLTRKFAADVPNMINFEFNQANLDASAQAVLMQQANWIKQFPEVRFRVYGHTDLVGGNAFNQRLGLRRAQAVVSFLVSQGISRSRLEAVASYGETQPLVQTEDPERQNRRTVTEVSGFVSKNPALLNGKYAALIFRNYVLSSTPPHSGGIIDTVVTGP